jgi:hypothetical protein
MADLHGKLVVFLFVAKGAGHATAPGVDLGYRDSRHAARTSASSRGSTTATGVIW